MLRSYRTPPGLQQPVLHTEHAHWRYAVMHITATEAEEKGTSFRPAVFGVGAAEQTQNPHDGAHTPDMMSQSS